MDTPSPVAPLTDAHTAQAEQRPARFYRPELDVLRFFAFLLIFVRHILPDDPSRVAAVSSNHMVQRLGAQFAAAFGAGLPLFFTLSAYLLTALLLRERARSGTVHIPSFYVRRMLRIWPLYLGVVLVSWLAAFLFNGEHQIGYFLANLFLVGNWVWWFGFGAHTPLELGHLWSISVEEQFYLFFPAFAKYFRPAKLFWLILLLVAGSVGTIFYCTHSGTALVDMWRNSFVQFLMFAGGIALGLYFHGRRLPTLSMTRRFGLLLAAVLLIFGAEFYSNPMGTGYADSALKLAIGYLAVCAACCLLIVAFLGWPGQLPKPLIYLGKISYGLYVFHAWGLTAATALLHNAGGKGAVLLLAKDALALALTVAMAALSYRLWETPFLKLKERFTFVKSRPA